MASSGDWSVYFQNQKLRSPHPGLEKPSAAQGAQQEDYNPYWSELHRRQHTPPGITGVQSWDWLKFIFVSLFEMLVGKGMQRADEHWCRVAKWQRLLGRNVFPTSRTSRACTEKIMSHGVKRKASSGKLLSLIYAADKTKFLTQK